MKWNVTNAVNRDVERQHLNKILKEISDDRDALFEKVGLVGDSLSQTQQQITNTIIKVINTEIPPERLVTTVTLTGDVTGTSVPVPGQNAVTIECDLQVNFLEDAPSDANAYWRRAGQWEAVPPTLYYLNEIEGSGLAVWNEEEQTWVTRQIESADSGRVVVSDGDGLNGNPTIDLALVPDGGVAPTLLKITRDAYGRVTNTQAATATDVPIAKLGAATWDNVQEYINVMNSPGLVDGGGFSDGGSGNLAYSSMRIAIRPTDDDTSTLYMADVAGGSVAIPNDSVTRFVGVQYNAGSPNVIVKTANTWNYDTEFPLGEVANLGGTLFPLFNPFKVGDPITNIIQRFDAQAPLIRDAGGGLELSTDGTTRNLAMTAGRVWARLNDYSIIARNSPTVPLVRVTPTGGTPPLAFTPGITAWPNTEYLSGTTLTTMTNNRWAVLWVFVNIGTGSWGFAHGTAQYLNSSAAAQEQIPAYLTQNFLRQNILVGRLIFEKNATTAIIESAFTRVFSTQAVSDHNQLSGLQGGTLGQYFHLTSAELARVPPASGTNSTFLRGDNTWANTLNGTFTAVGMMNISSGTPAYYQATSTGGIQSVLSSNDGLGLGFFGTLTAHDLAFVASSGIVMFLHADGTVFRPNADNATSLGRAANRWSVVYAATGSINTSDAREKTDVRPFTTEEIAAAIALSKEVGMYKWLSSVEAKGDAARWHVGMTVQRAIEVMELHGLDPFVYGFICHDTWEAEPEQYSEWPDALDDEGNVVAKGGSVKAPAIEAGDTYSFRPDGLLAFILRGVTENQSLIEARLSALENK